MKNEMIAAIAGLAVSGIASAAFVNYSVVSTAVTSGGQSLVRHELFANRTIKILETSGPMLVEVLP